MRVDLTDLTLFEAASLLAKRQISPRELVEAHLARIDRMNPHLNCFITLNPESAMEKAQQAEKEIRRGNYRGPLHGIPIALKDLYETAGVRTTAGSKFFSDYHPSTNGVVVQKLKANGAINLGKLNMHEIALGVTNDNPHFGACRNPWDLERTPGGSSGGSAAALAAGLCLGSMGTDTGGSIRIPSSLCGVVGLKPTFGRISLRGVIPLSWNLDHAGPMARSVRDVAILFQAVAGYDPDDPYSIDVPAGDYLSQFEAGVAGWHIALAVDKHFTRADEEVLTAVRQAAKTFTDLGARVEEVEIPQAKEAAVANGVMTTSDAAGYHHQRLQQSPEGFGQDVLQRLRSGAAVTSSQYVLTRHTQARLRRQYERLLADYHALLTPTTPIPAPPLKGPDAIEQARILTSFTAPFNLTGLPAMSLPCGFTTQRLPIGLQIVGSPWDESRLLRAAYAYEQAAEWHRIAPKWVDGDQEIEIP